MNPAGVQLLGYPSEQALLADPDHSLRMPPWTGSQWEALCEQAQREGRQTVRAQIRHHTGEPFRGYIELAYFKLEERRHSLVNITGKSPLQQAERELVYSRRFEAVFASATIGTVVCDRDGTMVLANDLAGQLFGYATSELLGQRIEVLVPDAAGRKHAQLRVSCNAQPQVHSMGAPKGRPGGAA
ncbi:PAS domain S-box protein [Hymenobacter sp. B1770]|uniref:PAS domain S-box protein n=1 Tax=Hymenobacter sp. B1770 TaxID=1718788 RepID=UPI003CF0D5ED